MRVPGNFLPGIYYLLCLMRLIHHVSLYQAQEIDFRSVVGVASVVILP